MNHYIINQERNIRPLPKYH